MLQTFLHHSLIKFLNVFKQNLSQPNYFGLPEFRYESPQSLFEDFGFENNILILDSIYERFQKFPKDIFS